jgi:hypothetical protein
MAGEFGCKERLAEDKFGEGVRGWQELPEAMEATKLFVEGTQMRA